MTKLNIITMSDIASEPTNWLWEPYIPRGAITLIQGDGGGGKTTVSLAVATAVSTGAALPNGGHTAPTAVIIQNAEDSYSKTIKPRLERFGADSRLIHSIDEGDAALTLSDERIEAAIVQTGAKLLVLDPVQAYFGCANMNSAGGVRPLMKRLGDVAERTDCAILLVGHLNKGKGRSAYRGLGSIDIFAAARSVLTVGKLDDDARAIVQIKNNLAPIGSPQAFTLDGGFAWLGERDVSVEDLMSDKSAPSASQFDRAKRLIRAELVDGAVPSSDMERLAEEQGISPKTLNRAKSELGVISTKRGAVWYWELPIDVEFVEHGQGGQAHALTILTTLKEAV